MTTESIEKTEYTLLIPDSGVQVDSITQYGCRYPDGTVKWNADTYRGSWGEVTVDFAKFHEPVQLGRNNSQRNYWADLIAKRADAANIDRQVYAGMHQWIKRTLIVSVTEAEVIPD